MYACVCVCVCVCTYVLHRAVVGSPAGLAMAELVFGNGIKLTSNIKSINFQIYSFCSFVDFEINSVRLEFILSLVLLVVGYPFNQFFFINW